MWAGVSELLCRVNSGSMLYHASKLRLYPLLSVVLSVDSEKSEGTLDITQLVGWLISIVFFVFSKSSKYDAWSCVPWL